MDIAEIRKKAKMLKTKLKDMEGSLRADNIEGREALNKLKGKSGDIPVETTPEAQKASKFKMAEALDMHRDEKEIEKKVETPKEELKEEVIEESTEELGLSAEDQKEFEELQRQAELEESGEVVSASQGEKQSDRLLDKLVTESVEAELKLEKEADAPVMPDLLDVDDVFDINDKDNEEVDLGVFGEEEPAIEEPVEKVIEEPVRKVKKSKADTKKVIKEEAIPEVSEDDQLESATLGDQEIEWGSDEELDEVVDFEVEALIFSLGIENYGIDIQLLSEVIKSAELIDVPRAPKGTHGVLSLRGHIIPVMDLKERIGLDSESTKNRILILKDDDGFVGLYVDSVNDVIGFTADALEPAPNVSSIDTSFISSLGRHEDKPYIILDMHNILEKI